jgi:Ca2+-binding RTX toxin-like protein
LVSLVATAPAKAADFTVTNLNDDGPGSLRQVLADAGTSPETDRVLFGSTVVGTLTLTSGELQVPGGVEIVGPGANRLTISGGGQSRIFHPGSASPPVSISGLTLVDGVNMGAGGGAIASSGTLSLSGLVVRSNRATAGAGGGVAHLGTGPLTVRDSTFVGNTAMVGGGGGIFVSSGEFSIERSTVSGNSAPGSDGGGINHGTGGSQPLTITDSTVAGNSSGASGGGVFFASVARLTNSVVADNTGPGRPDIDGADMVNPDARASFSLIEQLGGAPVAVDGSDLTGIDPKLAPLAENGGSTPTQALQVGSPALDKGSSGAAADQRGFPRPFDLGGIPLASGGNSADMGAYERVVCGKVLATRIGTAGADRISGTPGPDGILGLGGKDKLKGLKGNDSLCGGPGKDKLRGGAGRDSLFGQGGKDLLVGGKGKDKLKGGGGKDKVRQ